MRSFGRSSMPGFVSTIILFTGLSGSAARPLPSPAPAGPAPCTAPEYRQFDFWIGIGMGSTTITEWHGPMWIAYLMGASCGKAMKAQTV